MKQTKKLEIIYLLIKLLIKSESKLLSNNIYSGDSLDTNIYTIYIIYYILYKFYLQLRGYLRVEQNFKQERCTIDLKQRIKQR